MLDDQTPTASGFNVCSWERCGKSLPTKRGRFCSQKCRSLARYYAKREEINAKKRRDRKNPEIRAKKNQQERALYHKNQHQKNSVKWAVALTNRLALIDPDHVADMAHALLPVLDITMQQELLNVVQEIENS